MLLGDTAEGSDTRAGERRVAVRLAWSAGLAAVLVCTSAVVLTRSDRDVAVLGSGDVPSSTAAPPVLTAPGAVPTSTALPPIATSAPATTAVAPVVVNPPAASAAFVDFVVPTPASGVQDLAIGPDGAVWFTESERNKIGRVTAAGGFTEFPVPGTQPFGITAGPDGALWFTERAAGRIGRITTAGVITEYDVPTTTSNPLGLAGAGAGLTSIAAGPDGALWFTEGLADKIGRITTAGAVAEYPLPSIASSHANPAGIALGPDGGMWFTQQLGAKIGRIDPATKTITEFPLPSLGGIVGLASIVGTDQALWFAETGKVSRITPDGRITRYDAPFATTPGGEGVAAGNGVVWFTEGRANRLGRVTPDGQVTEVDVPTADAGPTRLVVDSTGAVWFTEPRANRIARLRA